MTITIYTYCPFSAYFLFAFIPPIPFCSLNFAIFDVVMNLEARVFDRNDFFGKIVVLYQQ